MYLAITSNSPSTEQRTPSTWLVYDEVASVPWRNEPPKKRTLRVHDILEFTQTEWDKNSDLMGFYSDLMGFYSDFPWDFIVIQWDINGILYTLW